jgi:hypothetical protein
MFGRLIQSLLHPKENFNLSHFPYHLTLTIFFATTALWSVLSFLIHPEIIVAVFNSLFHSGEPMRNNNENEKFDEIFSNPNGDNTFKKGSKKAEHSELNSKNRNLARVGVKRRALRDLDGQELYMVLSPILVPLTVLVYGGLEIFDPTYRHFLISLLLPQGKASFKAGAKDGWTGLSMPSTEDGPRPWLLPIFVTIESLILSFWLTCYFLAFCTILFFQKCNTKIATGLEDLKR